MAGVTAPVQGFTGKVVGVAFTDGRGETDNEAALAYFARHGYTIEQGEPEPEEFDPAEHTVEEVRDYLDNLPDEDAEAHDAEVARVVEAEKAGKNRTTLLESIVGTPEGK